MNYLARNIALQPYIWYLNRWNSNFLIEDRYTQIFKSSSQQHYLPTIIEYTEFKQVFQPVAETYFHTQSCHFNKDNS